VAASMLRWDCASQAAACTSAAEGQPPLTSTQNGVQTGATDKGGTQQNQTNNIEYPLS